MPMEERSLCHTHAHTTRNVGNPQHCSDRLSSFPAGQELWARQASNLQPTDYEAGALTRLSYGPGFSNC